MKLDIPVRCKKCGGKMTDITESAIEKNIDVILANHCLGYYGGVDIEYSEIRKALKELFNIENYQQILQNQKDAQDYRLITGQIESLYEKDKEIQKLELKLSYSESQHKKLVDAIQDIQLDKIIPILKAVARDEVISKKNCAIVNVELPKLQNLLKESEKE